MPKPIQPPLQLADDIPRVAGLLAADLEVVLVVLVSTDQQPVLLAQGVDLEVLLRERLADLAHADVRDLPLAAQVLQLDVPVLELGSKYSDAPSVGVVAQRREVFF